MSTESANCKMSSKHEHSNGEHIILLPFLAQGHLIPLMALAKLLEHRRPGCTITIVSTHLNVQKLKLAVPPDSVIQFSELPFCSSDHGLPPDTENTEFLPPHLMLYFLKATMTLQPALDHLVSKICIEDGKPPLCIISDFQMSWSIKTAQKFGVFHAIFAPAGAFGSAIFISICRNLPHKKTDAEVFQVPDMTRTFVHRTQVMEDFDSFDGADLGSITYQKLISFYKESEGALINTVEDLEAGALDDLRKHVWKRVWTVGPILPPPPSSSSAPASSCCRVGKEMEISPQMCIEWLSQHPPKTVLYISFGSENSVGLVQMMELAKGLEESKQAFIWIIRPPFGFNKNEEFKAAWLPDGFEERMTKIKRRGLLLRKWAPQLEILSHESTAAFLSHCGWNSTLESLTNGVPIIGWPLAWEQFYNSKLLEEELGVGMEIARGPNTSVSGIEIARIVGEMMEGKKGEEMRKKAWEIKEMIKAAKVEKEGCKGSSIKAMEDFFKAAASWKETIS